MRRDLVPLHHAQQLLTTDWSFDEIVLDLQLSHSLDYVGAVSALTAAILLLERGLEVSL